MQHGANMAFILVELFLNCIPFVPYLMGYLGLYVATFGLWAFTYFRLTTLWLYPVRTSSFQALFHSRLADPHLYLRQYNIS